MTDASFDEIMAQLDPPMTIACQTSATSNRATAPPRPPELRLPETNAEHTPASSGKS
ncbi:MAG: hypothetical protein U5K30_02165 [Acidimicrobiales bacterium]|nr:hypothetical protein [Acidimicrobiales bacterium]